MRPHRLEAVPLMFGLIFTALGLWFLRGDVDVWRVDWSWFWPAVLILSGLMVLLSLRPGVRPDEASRPDTVAVDAEQGGEGGFGRDEDSVPNA